MKKINIQKVFLVMISLSLISLGWYQEVYYYRFTFTSIGLRVETSTIAGISLSLLLGYFAYNKKVIRFTLLLIFSIAVTIVGQNQSFEIKKNEYTLHTAAYTELTAQKDRYTLEIETLNGQIRANEELLPNTIQGRANWATKGVKPLEEKIDKLKIEKKDYESLLIETINKLSTGTTEATLFENIANDIPFLSPTVMKYVFMSFMSLFIALMAPAGITMLSTSKPQPKRKQSRAVGQVVKQQNTADKISVFVNGRFDGIDKPSVLRSRKDVVENTALTYGEFNGLSKRAVDLGLISVQGNKSVPTVNKSKFEMMLRNRQSVSDKIRSVR
jgi:hypothetical protein